MTNPVLDTFTRADSTTSLGSPDIGQAWSNLDTGGSQWGITSDQAALRTLAAGANNSQSVAVLDALSADATVVCDVTTSSVRVDCGLVGRVADNSNYLLVALVRNNNGAVVSTTLYKRDTGTFTSLATTGTGPALGTLYTVSLVMLGNSVSVLFGSTVILTYTLTSAEQTKYGSNTKHGIRVNYTDPGVSGNTGDDAGTRFDNFRVSAPAVGGSSYADVVLRDAPLGYWRLNEASGTQAKDISGHGYHGTYVGTPTLGVGSPLKGDASAGAATFDGSTQYVELNAGGLNIQSPLTAESFLKSTMTGEANFIGFFAGASSQFGWGFDLSSGVLRFWNGVAWTADATTVNDNVWHHVVTTYASGVCQFYVDGALKSTATGLASSTPLSADTLHALASVEFHSTYPNSGSPFVGNKYAGSLAECAVYGSALSAGQVRTHYRAARRSGVVGP